MIKMETNEEYQEAEKAALRLVARAEQCSNGLSLKLKKRGFDDANISAVITRLSALNLVNDRRFAQLWLESHLRLATSPRRLLISLCGRGIDHDDAEAALKIVLDREAEQALLLRCVRKYSHKTSRGNEEADPGILPELRSIKYKLRNEGFSAFVIEWFFEEFLPNNKLCLSV